MVSAPPCARVTPLERYVALPDPSYRWKAIAALPGSGYTTHLIELVSQCWRDESEVDRPRWQHQLRLVVPDEIANDTALLVIAGGSNDKPAPARANPLLAIAAMMTRSVTAELRMVPNQPLTFAGETDPRAEDGIIAYSWDKYLRTGDETWPLRLPMTKSVVRAMDAITGFCRSPAGGGVEIAQVCPRGSFEARLDGMDRRSGRQTRRCGRSGGHRPAQYRGLLRAPLSRLRLLGAGDCSLSGFRHHALGGDRRAGSLLEIEDPFAYRDRLSHA